MLKLKLFTAAFSNLSQVRQACKIFNSLPFEVLDQSCSIVADHFFPLRNNHDRIIPLLSQVVEQNELNGSLAIDKEKIGSYGVGQQIYEMMLRMIEFLDSSNIGFLTGDIHPMTFNVLQSQLDQPDDLIPEALRKTLFSQGRSYKLPLNGIKNPDLESQRQLFERQLIVEEESHEAALEKFHEVFADLQRMNMAHNLQLAQSCVVQWFPTLTKQIQKEQILCANPSSNQQIYAIYLTALSAEKIAVLALEELLKELISVAVEYRSESSKIDGYQIRATRLYLAIGQAINKQYIYEQEDKKLRVRVKQELQQLVDQQQQEPTEAESKEAFMAKELKKSLGKQKFGDDKLRTMISNNYLNRFDCAIPKEVQIQIGTLITYFIVDSIRFRNENNFQVPLLVQSLKSLSKNQATAVLNVNQKFLQHLMEGMSRDNSMFMHLDRSLPMIFPPSTWQDYQIGGYYQRPTNLLRLTDSKLQEDAAKHADLSRLFDVLDTVSQVPWRINNKILDVIMKLWEEGGGIAEIPRKNIDNTLIYENQFKECKSNVEKYKLMKKIQMTRDQYSLKCDFTLKLSVATSFSGCSKIYFPHNMDFRGRLYPIPPHLNHMGADLSRGLLQFAEGRSLGAGGLRWLKIHLANKMGKDKLSLEDRVLYVDQNIEMIKRCAKDPFTNREWATIEDAWQSLAAMFDYVAAIESPNPHEYISHMHVHQDGSCNGLQHYAALGRDVEGATQVNLAASERPGDVYTHVANMVEKRIAADALEPLNKNNELAIKLQNQIKRKIVKQTVMTSVYGVTFIGAREQIHRQLKDKEILAEDDHLQYQASYYLAKITLEAIKDLFEGAHKIKQWLIKCATLISNLNQPVSWITPLGLPVIQPYRTLNRLDQVKTVMSNVIVQQDTQLLPVNKVKQRSAFPPNFIHSLDSTHLMYTSIECKKVGITFAAVHDSYWTHACHVDKLNELLRDQFVRLHSQPLLEELRDSFVRRYPGIDFPEIPERGTFDLERVKQSIYFFA